MIHLLKTYFNTTAKVDFFNATHDVKRALRESKVQNGVVTILVPGATAAILLLENDPTIHENVRDLVVSFVPKEGVTRPERRSGSGRLSSHLQAALLPKSISILVQEARLMIDAWQEVIVFDFDDKVARREVFIQVMGEGTEEKKEKK